MPYVEAADKEEWTEDNAKQTQRFFMSYTGRKLSARLINFAIKSSLAAVGNPNVSPYQNGQASGISATIAAIEAHYPQEQEQEAESTELDAMEAQQA